MSDQRENLSRREFVGRSMLAGTAGLLGLRPEPVAAEPPPETTRIRLVRSGAICISPLYVAEDLFRLEGFTDVEYVEFKTAAWRTRIATSSVGTRWRRSEPCAPFSRPPTSARRSPQWRRGTS